MSMEGIPDTVLVYITVGSIEEAERIAEALVTKKLAACANIHAGVRSIYTWEGKLQRDDEVVIIAKTVAKKFSVLEAMVLEIHSYDMPCIVGVPITAGHEPFLQWIQSETN